MSTLIGIVGLAIFIVLVISLAAVITAAVVRISPTRGKAPSS